MMRVCHTALWLVAASATAQTWTLQNPSVRPLARLGHAMAFDSVTNAVLLFGGVNGATLQNDTWLWNGAMWTQVTAGGSAPSARRLHAMAHDPVRREVVVFGGVTDAEPDGVADTWVWNGSMWSRKTPAASPAPRSGHIMAWDPVSQRVILFGGSAKPAGAPYADASAETWAWDGSAWLRLTPATTPTAGSGYMAATDTARGQIMIYGGPNGEAWVWDGVAWAAKPSPGVTAGSWGGALAWDGASGRVILFTQSSTWAWNGANWTELATSVAPGPRHQSAAAWDATRGRLVLFGGNSATFAPLDDAWTFSYGNGCSFTQPGGNQQPLIFPSTGGPSELSVPISAGCSWNAVSEIPWISFTQQTGAAGTPVRFQLAPNTDLFERVGYIRISGREFLVVERQPPCPAGGPLPQGTFLQRGGCNVDYTFTASAGDQIAIMAEGRTTGTIHPLWVAAELTLTGPANNPNVSATPRATNPPTVPGPIITMLPASGAITLPSTGTYTVRIDAGGTLVLGTGNFVRVTSVVNNLPCMERLSTEQIPTYSLGFSGWTISVQVGVPPGCHIPVSSNQPWLTPSTQTLPAGFSDLRVVASRNYGAARSATLTIGTSSWTIVQEASGCAVTAAAPNTDAAPGLGSGQVTISASTHFCSWDASSSVSWLQPYPLTGSGSGQVQYTVFPNFSGSARTGTLTIAGQTFTIRQAASAETLSRRFVQLLYFSFFGRMPSAQEIDFQIASGQTRQQLALNFFNSAEFNNGGRYVAGLYVGLLNRDAEYGGWLFQRNALSGGVVNPISILQNFIASAEFAFYSRGLADDAKFVALLYKQILLRDPTAAEVAFQAAALSAGASTQSWPSAHAQLARNFLSGEEFRAGTGPRLTAFLLYATLLQRGPGSQELTATSSAVTNLNSIVDPAGRQAALRDQFIAPIVHGPELNLMLQ